MTQALARGGEDWKLHYGWGQDRDIAANTFDMLTVDVRASGNWKKIPDIPSWPRPWEKQAKADSKPKTLEDVFARFAGAKVLPR